MNVLFIAPLPPPVNGQSLVSQRLLEHLQSSHHVTEVNIRKNSLKDGMDSATRVGEVLQTFRAVYRHRRQVDTVYLTVSESLAGNIKDLVICLICRRLRGRMYVHLHGGSLRRLLYDRYRSIRWLNKVILKGLRGAIVSGPSHLHVFDGIVEQDRVFIAANYASDDLFLAPERVAGKFESAPRIRILYISHMTEKKGYQRLADGYLAASDAVREAVQIDFAGAFENDANEKSFLERVGDTSGIRYHGVVTNDAKRALFEQANVLCLPTSFLEGQPISILEAYAAGCVVVATGQPGILDVFTPDENGYVLGTATPQEIAGVLSRLVAERSGLGAIGLRNRKLAEDRYRASISMERVAAIIEGRAAPTRQPGRA